MSKFASTYYGLLPGDPDAAFGYLAPSMQKNGGITAYKEFWTTISSVKVSSMQPDPSAGKITFDILYVRANGTQLSQQQVFNLTPNGDSFLIASAAVPQIYYDN